MQFLCLAKLSLKRNGQVDIQTLPKQILYSQTLEITILSRLRRVPDPNLCDP